MIMRKDRLYSEQRDSVNPFVFDETVANVFDDMLNRSVPYYAETIHRLAQLVVRFYQPGSTIYDLGCSHGNLGLCVVKEMRGAPFQMVAVDNSRPMLKKYKKRLGSVSERNMIALMCNDIQEVDLENASVVVINLTLQFIPPHLRTDVIRSVYRALLPGGILLLTEKIVHHTAEFSQLQQEFYHRFKKENGYSDLEISQKRDALENVLIPDTVECHLDRLSAVGFSKIDIWQKWFNFASFICQK